MSAEPMAPPANVPARLLTMGELLDLIDETAGAMIDGAGPFDEADRAELVGAVRHVFRALDSLGVILARRTP